MKKILEKSTLLVLIAVISSLIASVAAFVWGAVKTIMLLLHLITSYGKDPAAMIGFIALMDTFLIAFGHFGGKD